MPNVFGGLDTNPIMEMLSGFTPGPKPMLRNEAWTRRMDELIPLMAFGMPADQKAKTLGVWGKQQGPRPTMESFQALQQILAGLDKEDLHKAMYYLNYGEFPKANGGNARSR